jgi:hypothetical protein
MRHFTEIAKSVSDVQKMSVNSGSSAPGELREQARIATTSCYSAQPFNGKTP